MATLIAHKSNSDRLEQIFNAVDTLKIHLNLCGKGMNRDISANPLYNRSIK